MLIPDDSSPISTTKGLSPPEKLARVMSPEEALATQHEMRPVPQPRQSIQVIAKGLKKSYVSGFSMVPSK